MPALSRTTHAEPTADAADLVAALVGVLAVAAPFVRFGYGADLYDSKRLAVIAVLGIGVLACSLPSAVRALQRGTAGLPRWTPVALGVAVALGIASGAVAQVPVYAFAEIGVWVVLAALALVVGGRWAGGDGRAFVEMVVVASAASYATAVIWGHAASLWDGGLGWPGDATGGFGNRRFVNQAQLVLLPVLLSLAARLRADGGARLWAVRALAALQVAVLIASGGRGALVALAIGAAAVVLLFGSAARPLLREALVATGLGVVVYVGAFVVPGAATDQYVRSDLMSRRDIHWAASLRMAADRPLLGIGPMHYAFVESPGPMHPHNIVLQLASEWGTPAMLLVVAVVGRGLWAWRGVVRRGAPDPARTLWLAALTAALLASLAHGMVDSFLMAPSSQLWGVLLLAALTGEAGRRVSVPGGAPTRLRLAVPLVLAVALAPAVTVAVVDAPGLDRRAIERSAWLSQTRWSPRFWQVGAIAPPEGAPVELTRRYWPDPAAAGGELSNHEVRPAP